MTDNRSFNEPTEGDELRRYNALVERRAALEQEISHLLSGPDGARAVQLPRYRVLARERDEVISEMRTLEQGLRLDE
ncbi:MAG: hypothetical protein SNJ54_03560 [Anaerolineae bacterium]